MPSTLDQYRQAKNDYLKLRNQAKKELLARFNQVANELFDIQRELLEDFGEKVSIPAKGKNRPAPRRGSKTAAAKPEPPEAPSPEVIALRKQLDKQKKRVTELQTAGKPTKAAEDKVYEIEDAIRLAQSK